MQLSHRQVSRRAGSAYLETLAVAILFSALLACALGFGRVYAAKVISGQLAREAAWARTHERCGEASAALPPAIDAVVVAPTQSNAQALLLAVSRQLRAASAEPSVGRFTTPSAQRGPLSVETETLFSCNEVPHSTRAAGSELSLRKLLGEVLP